MERVSAQPSAQDVARCSACETVLEADRCGHCGAASKAGPYRIKKVLSQNAQGRVYLAADEAGAEVALKELVYTMVPSVEELDAFERETQLLQQLEHPQIPRFVKGFTVGSGAHTRLYLAQQLVRGESLEQRLTHHRFTEDEVRDLGRQVLEVLAWLNDRRPPIVHRDLKPANLILSPEGKLHLIDFGTARDVKSGGTHRSTLVGTVGYMAPEQLGGTVSHQSDLYGLGATLAHLVTRQRPEELTHGGHTIDVGMLDVSVGLRGFLRGLLALSPNNRFADARAALRGLDAGVKLNSASRELTLIAITMSGVLAISLGGLLVLRTRSEQPAAAPVEVVKPVEQPKPQAPAVVPAPRGLKGAIDYQDQPDVTRTAFSWQIANWEFDKPGSWLLDTTGHRASVPYPHSGYRVDFFGPVWDGSQSVLVKDAERFAMGGRPFHIEVSLSRQDTHDSKVSVDPKTVQHLITRGDPDGQFAYDLSLQGNKVHFTLMDAAGERSTITGDGEWGSGMIWLYAQFDSETGDQWIHQSGQCKPLAHAVTKVRPAMAVRSNQVVLIEKYQGRIHQIQLLRGLMLPSGPPSQKGGCGFNGTKLE
jgi:hypothetical protein